MPDHPHAILALHLFSACTLDVTSTVMTRMHVRSSMRAHSPLSGSSVNESCAQDTEQKHGKHFLFFLNFRFFFIFLSLSLFFLKNCFFSKNLRFFSFSCFCFFACVSAGFATEHASRGTRRSTENDGTRSTADNRSSGGWADSGGAGVAVTLTMLTVIKSSETEALDYR